MEDNIAISVKGLTKGFKVPHEKHDTLKAKAVNIFSKMKYTKHTALEDISFDIKKGEFFGIIGKNGCGKSTLLKIIAGIYQPTSGMVEVIGNIAPFIELGVGFNPELTGRENVFLSGTILGLPRKKIEQLYNEIVDFAELKEFMDQKLKYYSSGMQVRLAFSIAVRADSDILLIDEVLAVGDAAFQAKCLNYFETLKEQKRTVVFVSHDMDTVKKFCDRVVLINDSRVILDGKPNSVCGEYYRLNSRNTISNSEAKAPKILKYVKITSEKITNNSIFNNPKLLTIEIEWKKNGKVKNLGIAIYNNEGTYCYGTNTKIDGFTVIGTKARLNIIKPQLAKGFYVVKVMLFEDKDDTPLEFIEEAARFKIEDNTHRQGIVKLDTDWS